MIEQTVIPYITVHDAKAAIDFYKRAFGAVEMMSMLGPDGTKIVHASLRIGSSIIYLSDEFPEWGNISPKTLGNTTCSLHIKVDDVDAAFSKAIAEGAESLMAPEDMFWGDRYSGVVDPFGHKWNIFTHIEDVSEEELRKRSEEFFAQSI